MPAFPVRLSAANDDEYTVDPFDALMGYTLRALRLERGLSLGELARSLGLTALELSLYERGELRLTVERLLAMAAALDMPIEAFYADRTS